MILTPADLALLKLQAKNVGPDSEQYQQVLTKAKEESMKKKLFFLVCYAVEFDKYDISNAYNRRVTYPLVLQSVESSEELVPMLQQTILRLREAEDNHSQEEAASLREENERLKKNVC